LATNNTGMYKLYHRPAFLHACVSAIAVELFYNWIRPKATSKRTAGLLLLCSAVCSAIDRAGVFGLLPAADADAGGAGAGGASFDPVLSTELNSGSLHYSYQMSFVLQLAASCFAIPTSQLGALYTVNHPTVSQASWRILGWIVTVALGLGALLLPQLVAAPGVALTLSVLPSVGLASVLCAAPAADNGTGGGDGGCAKPPPATSPSPPTNMLPTAAGSATTTTALTFICCGGVVGTNGEALLDTFLGVLTRAHVKLALWNQAAVLLAMVLAYGAESRLKRWDKSAAQRSMVYLWVWAGSQLLRVLLIKSITPETGQLLFGLVLLDKFSGPLGGAALEMALLALLTTSRTTKTGGGGGGGGAEQWIPFAFLMTVRTAVETTSRPFAEWVLLPLLHDPAVLCSYGVELAALVLTGVAVLFVAAMLAAPAPPRSTKEA
jgi:hypothetical protein